MQEADILFETKGRLGLITLNRPKALNALTRAMCVDMYEQLKAWERDPNVAAVAIRGMGPRAFSAGGDIRAMAASSEQETEEAADFLSHEYRLNAAIGAFAKPFVALTHGVVMGGGAGVSVHGSLRAADADLVFAMPEMGIGFIPDIGASYFLSRCPGETGMYLALTGQRIGLGDARAWGLMTHHLKAADHDAVIERLAHGEAAEKVLATFAQEDPPAPSRRDLIDLVFSASSVEAALERLDRGASAWAAETAALVRSRSPTSLKLAFRLVREGKKLTREDCLRMEYRVAARRVMEWDFREGVRAQLRDKDNAPKWRPSALAAVGDDAIAHYFTPLGARELSF